MLFSATKMQIWSKCAASNNPCALKLNMEKLFLLVLISSLNFKNELFKHICESFCFVCVDEFVMT